MSHPPSIHATLALRHTHTPIPTLLSPLTPISNTPLVDEDDDQEDDFQSNAWVDAPSYRAPLTGLGITYLRDTFATFDEAPLVVEDSVLQMQVDDFDRRLPRFPANTRATAENDFPASIFPYRGSDRRLVHLGSDPSLRDACPYRTDLDVDSDVDHIVGLIPDVNMYDRLRRLDLPHLGVNPLDTIRSTPSYNITISPGEPAPNTPDDHRDDDISSITNVKVEQSPSPRVLQDIMSILVQPDPESPFLIWPPGDSPSIQGLSQSPLALSSPVSVKLEPTHVSVGEQFLGNLEYPKTTHSPPILNAHLGIELSELISRAERYRARNPDQDIDRAWLSRFAGKLSDCGGLLNDFRCYVIGCAQRNKRRDHILVHVGAHVGQRPFACSLCPLRFLRKNECKRHEASHSGSRPYSCDTCGQSFVRQDLVKRHAKRAHGGRDENQSGAAKQRHRKKARP